MNPNNIENYWGEKMYIARHGYISPIWSRELTLRFMAAAAKEKWNLVVHDCSNDTKFARDLNLGVKEGKWFGASSYTSEFLDIPYAIFSMTLSAQPDAPKLNLSSSRPASPNALSVVSVARVPLVYKC